MHNADYPKAWFSIGRGAKQGFAGDLSADKKVGDVLDREKAVELVKEMVRVCGIDLEKSSLVFMPKNSEGIPSKDVQLHISTPGLDFGSRNCLYALMDERRWKFREEPDKIVIIEPATDNT